MEQTNHTRRGLMKATCAAFTTAYGLTATAKGQVQGYLFEIDGLVSPDSYTYDVYQWQNENAVLRFEDSGDGSVAKWGTSDPPPDGIEPATEGIDLPLDIKFTSMQQGVALLLVGINAILLAAAAFFRNMAAGIMWALAFIVLILSGLYGIGLELYWLLNILTVALLIVGMAVRWS